MTNGIGSIAGSKFAITAQTANVVSNSGAIEARADGGIAIQASAVASIVNRGANNTIGTITGNAIAITAPTVTVDNVGTIRATADNGIAINGDVVTVTNSGAISENGIGGRAINAQLSATSKATVSNLAGGIIVANGANGVAISAEAIEVANAGTIQAANGTAVGGGIVANVTNAAGGLITGGLFGIKVVAFDVRNAAGGTISGGFSGIDGSGTVTNAGTISGGTASVNFTGTGTNTLILQSGSVLNGDAVGSVGATNKLILRAPGLPITISATSTHWTSRRAMPGF